MSSHESSSASPASALELCQAWRQNSELSHQKPLRCFYAFARAQLGLPPLILPPPIDLFAPWILRRGIDPREAREQTLLHFEIAHLGRSPDSAARARALVAAGADPNAFWPQSRVATLQRPPLILAVTEGLIEHARLLLDSGAPPDGPSGPQAFPPPIFSAVSDLPGPGMLELLLSAGANPDAGTQEGLTALHAAALFDRPQAVAPLARAGANLRRRCASFPGGRAISAKTLGKNRGAHAFLAALEAAILERSLARSAQPKPNPKPAPRSL